MSEFPSDLQDRPTREYVHIPGHPGLHMSGADPEEAAAAAAEATSTPDPDAVATTAMVEATPTATVEQPAEAPEAPADDKATRPRRRRD